MRSSGNPLFALLPPGVLAKAKDLAREFDTEEQLKDLAGRRMFSLIGITVALVLVNLWIALAFLDIVTEPTVKRFFGWTNGIVVIYGLAICLGGTAFLFSAYVAWLEVVVFRRVTPQLNPREHGLRFYRRSTWLLLIPFTGIPVVVNAWFSMSFFLVMVSAVLVAVLIAFVYADI